KVCSITAFVGKVLLKVLIYSGVCEKAPLKVLIYSGVCWKSAAKGHDL
ncbi:hypothetical protein Gotur_021678, partial [Gossypium turneri]